MVFCKREIMLEDVRDVFTKMHHKGKEREMQKKKQKVCFMASSGGHYEQLMMLKPLMLNYDSFIVTEKTDYTLHEDIKTYYLIQINRREKIRTLKLIVNAITSVKILWKERPDAFVTTGVLSMVPLCLLAKLCGRKLIYIESFAKVTSPTKTGRLLYPIADQFYVQWESMLEIYPKAIYLGGIY